MKEKMFHPKIMKRENVLSFLSVLLGHHYWAVARGLVKSNEIPEFALPSRDGILVGNANNSPDVSRAYILFNKFNR